MTTSTYLREYSRFNNIVVGLYDRGMSSHPSNPLLAQASTIRFPQITNQVNTHNQPTRPPTRLPVTLFHTPSIITPTPCIRKNPITCNESPPRPIPRIPTSCKAPETANAPMTTPARPKNTSNGLLPTATKDSRKIWCHFRPQKLESEVENQGASKRGGHCDGYCRNSTMNSTAWSWYTASTVRYEVTPESVVITDDLKYRVNGGSDGSKMVPPFGDPIVSGPNQDTHLDVVSNAIVYKMRRPRDNTKKTNRDSTWEDALGMCDPWAQFHPIPLRFTRRSQAFHIAEGTETLGELLGVGLWLPWSPFIRLLLGPWIGSLA